MQIYQTIYNLIETYIFGTVDAGTYPELVTILLSTVLAIAVIVLPFAIVYKAALWIVDLWRA